MEDKLKLNIMKAIEKVINDPSHAIQSNTSKNILYNETLKQALADKVYEIITQYSLTNEHIPEQTKALLVKDYLKANVSIRRSYFDAFEERIPAITPDELPYRTAYCALVKGEAMCAGIAEACRIILEAIGIKTQTLLSKLPGKNKNLLHYVTLASTSDDKHLILDSERQASCEKKGYNFEEYQNSMDYLTPTLDFYNNKVGDNGVGPNVGEYMKDSIERKNKSSMFVIYEGNKVAIYSNRSLDEVPDFQPNEFNTLENLLSKPKFRDYIGSQRAVFMIHGTKDAKALSLIMDIISAQKTTNKENERGLGE